MVRSPLRSGCNDIRIDVPAFLAKNPDLEIHFDRGDVAWLRAYCHALCALTESYRSIDENVGFEERFRGVFPRLKPGGPKPDDQWIFMLKVRDTSRLRQVGEHLVAVCELNKEHGYTFEKKPMMTWNG